MSHIKKTSADARKCQSNDGYETLVFSEAEWLQDPFQFFTEWHSQADDEAFEGLC